MGSQSSNRSTINANTLSTLNYHTTPACIHAFIPSFYEHMHMQITYQSPSNSLILISHTFNLFLIICKLITQLLNLYIVNLHSYVRMYVTCVSCSVCVYVYVCVRMQVSGRSCGWVYVWDAWVHVCVSLYWRDVLSSLLFHIAGRLSIYLKFTFYKYPIVNPRFFFVTSSFDYALLYEGVSNTNRVTLQF